MADTDPESGKALNQASPTGTTTAVEPSKLAGDDAPKRQFSSVIPGFGSEWGPGKRGTIASLVLLLCGMVASIITMVEAEKRSNGTDYTSNCPEGFDESCAKNGAVMRYSFALSIMFALQLLGTAVYTPYYDALWIVKYIVYAGVVIGFFFTEAKVFDTNGYAWFARLCGFLFVIFQQVILLDFAFTWNEKWVKNDEDNENPGICGRLGLLIVSVLIFAVSYTGIGIMFWQFGGPQCSENNAILSLTIILTFIATFFQLTVNDSYSLLTSAFMTGYATYIAYASVSLNPRSTCNPTLASDYQTMSEIIGMVITVLSLLWTTYSTISRVTEYAKADASINTTTMAGAAESGYGAPGLRATLLEVSVVFILISCYYAMVLTNWATLQADDELQNTKLGRTAMWLQASAQWVAILFYMWALVAPKLFPDRDFGGPGR